MVIVNLKIIYINKLAIIQDRAHVLPVIRATLEKKSELSAHVKMDTIRIMYLNAENVTIVVLIVMDQQKMIV